MKESLATGAWSLNSDYNKNKRYYGATEAFGLPKEPGTVRLHLQARTVNWEPDSIPVRSDDIRWQFDGEDLIIDFPEEVALAVSGNLAKVAIQLEHLRKLLHLHQLADESLYFDEESIESLEP